MTDADAASLPLSGAEKRAILTRLLQERADRAGSAAPRAYPLSYAQERLWFLEQVQPASPVYVLSANSYWPGPVDRDALERALNAVVARHDVLRTTFRTIDNRPWQVVAPALTVPLALADLTAMSEGARMAEAQRLVREEALRGFDLSEGPLLRVLLLRLGPAAHALIVTMHHIVSDGWSIGLMLRELAQLYEAFAQGRPSPLPALALQYADFAVWQREHLSGAELERLLGYWRAQLAGMPPLLELPSDRPRPPVMSVEGAWQNFTLAPELGRRLEALALAQGATPFMVSLAGFMALLARYCGRSDIVVGTPVANRNRAEIEELIGFFVNSLVLRVDLSGNPSFAEILARVREVALDAYAHQDLPFERLVGELQPERTLSHNPLFQVMFDVQALPPGLSGQAQAAPVAPPDAEGEAEAAPAVGYGTSKFDLSVHLAFAPEGVHGTVEYSTALFDHATIGRLMMQFRRLLEAASAEPELALSELPLLSAEERHRQLVTWNETRADTALPATIHQLFEAQAARAPDRIALEDRGRSLSYGALDVDANRLAWRLRRLGAGRDSVVAICLPRGAQAVTAVLAILKAGAAYLPLDPSYPGERLRLMLDDVAAMVLVSTRELDERLTLERSCQAKILCLDAAPDAAPEEPAGPPDGEVRADDLAYVIHTSGSTGRPKGVMVPHRGLVSLAETQRRLFALTPADRVLQGSSLSFDIWMWDFLLAVGAGATLVIASEEARLGGRALHEEIACARLTAVTLLPSVLATLPLAPLPDVHTLIVGAEVCPAELVAAWAPGRHFFNGYGPTEVSVTSTMARCEPDGTRPGIGRPFIETTVYILDPAMQPVPIGATGEIHVGGSRLARGYFGQPALTAERFVPDPFSDAPGARLYRTGDRARFLPDGEIDFLGRIDQQVKLRGYRVELGEIEAVLGESSEVGERAVVVRGTGEARHLVAYVAPAAGRRLDQERLRQRLGARLPNYMLPAAFVVLDSLPRMPNGKPDLARLPEPEGGGAGVDPPATATEQAIAAIWQELLGPATVGRQDNFFELGGHSLLATQMVSRLRDRFAIDVPVRQVFEAPTPAALAALVDGMLGTPGAPAPAAEPTPAAAAPPASAAGRDARIRPRRERDAWPLSFGQERLWVLDQVQPGSPAYIIPAAVRLPGPVQPAALERALNEMVRRHEVLRATIRNVDGAPVQEIRPELALPLVLTDLSDRPAADGEAEARRLVVEEAARPFRLESGPLLRFGLIRLAETDHVLMVTLHHIVSDAWSMGVLFRELFQVYEAFARGLPSPLPEPALQYADFAAWQRARISGARLDRLVAYWRDKLAGAPALLALPTDRPRPEVQTAEGARQEFLLPPALSREAQALGLGEAATPFMTLLAAFACVLYAHSGESDLVLGTPVANRDRTEIEGLIGFFANTVVLRGDLSGNPSFRELLGRVRATTLEAYAHQELPFEQLVDALKVPRSMAYNPVFQVLFNLQGIASPAELDSSFLAPGGDDEVRIHPGAPKFDIELALAETAHGIQGLLEYNTALFDHERMTALCRDFRSVLEDVVRDPGIHLDELSLFAAEAGHGAAPPGDEEDFDFG